MRAVRLLSLLAVLSLLLAALIGSTVCAQDDAQPVFGQIVLRGVFDCFEEGLQTDKGETVYCETSAVVFVDTQIIFASDKPIPGDGRSSVFSFPYAGSGQIGDARTYLTAAPLLSAIKYEDMTLTLDGQYVIASTGFDRVRKNSNEWDGYNTLLVWPVGNPDQVKVVAVTTNEGITSSVRLRDRISQALTTSEFPEGVPYFKVEGITTLPDNRLLLGIREMGAFYGDFDYVVKILAAPYEIVDGEMTLTGDFKKIYDFNPTTECSICQKTVALSSIEYDKYNDRLYLLTSFETKETDECLGAYLWTLSLADLEAKRAPALVLNDVNHPLLFAHKGEGVTVLGRDSVLVAHDDDRVLGRDNVMNPETQFSRAANQAAYTLVTLTGAAPESVPADGTVPRAPLDTTKEVPMAFIPYLAGIVALLLAWVLYGLLAGTWNIWKLVTGTDGRASTSKLQWFLWTVVVVFAYVAIWAAGAQEGNLAPISEIPQNLLIAMGLSVTTMAAAKGITVSYVNSGRVIKTNADPGEKKDTGLGPLVSSDEHAPDLSKMQMMIWTLVAIAIYVFAVVEQIRSGHVLPDIDPTLMVLMGLGQGAYLGKKLVTTITPRLTGLSPVEGNPGTQITILGMAFGAEQAGSLVTMDRKSFEPQGLQWADSQIQFTLPQTPPSGQPWKPGQRVIFGVIVGGQESVNTLPFTVTVPQE